MTEPKKQQSELKKACVNCGAELKYKPGTTTIVCEYCGYKEQIKASKTSYKELELYAYLNEFGTQAHSEEITVLHCKTCGADQHVEENYKSLNCVYCGTPLIVEEGTKEQWILPGAVLPFQIDKKNAHQLFKKWVKGLWFAPNKLQKAALDPMYTKGLYLPYWTFDANLDADYYGRRGDHYYVTETYRVNGKTQTRQVRKTRWRSVSGHVHGFIDDQLIGASKLKSGRLPSKITNWNLTKLQPFNSEFLAGFVTEKYTISLDQGHLQSQQEMRYVAEGWARRDIGGDVQEIHSLDMELSDETFKHILLPAYICAYQYNGKKYNFYVNAENGTISGNRPYSFWKIFFLVIAILIVIGLFIYFKG
ncbi:DNA helicase PriA [Zhouia sp. PK063]|uniref:DNA helicase PriA n=1 Tax=Zhouia sp. PK063 TaxID=3373602 RepID=UPI00378EC4C4